MTDGPDEASADVEPEEEAKPQYVNEVRDLLLELLKSRRREVFYDRQLQVLLERKGELDITPRNAEGELADPPQGRAIKRNYYHWITSRALRQLAEEGRVATDIRALGVVEEDTRKPLEIRFFRHPSHRFWKRQADEITKLVQEFSQPAFTHALGHQGEVLFDSALGSVGFVQRGRETREYAGKRWLTTGHNLDRIYERDGVAWGTEIKNTLKYIERQELQIKMAMCRELGLRFLVIARALPSDYIWRLRNAGGFGLVYSSQLYPFGQGGFADRVRGRLGLPVHCPRAVPEGDAQRFLSYHERIVERGGGGGVA